MVSTRLLTKQDLIELVNEQYPEARPTEMIACMITMLDGCDTPGQQALVFNKELEGVK